MNRTRLLGLFCEFDAKIKALHTLYLDSIVGYSVLHERLRSHQENIRVFLGEHEFATEEFQNTCVIAYKDISACDFMPASLSPVMKQGELLHRVVSDGQNALQLGSQCIVDVFSYWDEYLRKEIGKASGVPHEEIKSDFWGDLRLIRHSIVHCRGIASPKMAECKLIKWFKPGDNIKLDYQKMHCIFLYMGQYRNEIHALSLPPEITLLVPSSEPQ